MTAILIAEDDADIRDLLAFKAGTGRFRRPSRRRWGGGVGGGAGTSPDSGRTGRVDAGHVGPGRLSYVTRRSRYQKHAGHLAAEALGCLGHRGTFAALCALLDDARPEVRVVAVRALGRIGDPAAAEPLLATLARTDPAPSLLVAHALIQLGPAGEPALIRALRHPAPLVGITVLDALGLLGAAASAGDVAELARADNVIGVRVAAVATLGRLGGKAVLEPLTEAAQSHEPEPLVLNCGPQTDPISTTRGFICLAKPIDEADLYNSLSTIIPGSPPAGLPYGTESVETVSPMPQHQWRILLVEDNEINQMVAMDILSGLGYDLTVANDGIEAVDLAAAGTYDAILMDCRMPRMDGFNATIAIRHSEGEGRRTPIIAMTASALESDREACLAAGMDDYLTKPFKATELDDILNRWTTGRATEAPADAILVAAPEASVAE